MKTLTISFLIVFIAFRINAQFEFKNTIVNGANPTLSGFVDSTTYLSVLDKLIYFQPLSQQISGTTQSIDMKLNCTGSKVLQMNPISVSEIGLLVKECDPIANTYYFYNRATNTLRKLILPNGSNGFLHYFDKTAKVQYITPENGEKMYMLNTTTGVWDSTGNKNSSISVLKMVDGKGIVYEINNLTNELTPAYTNDGGKTLLQLKNIDYNKAPFSKANKGTLYELTVITDSYWFARYSYDTAGKQVSKVFFTTDQGSTWKVALPFDVTQIVAAGNDAYVYKAKPGKQNGELYKVSEMGEKICMTNFKGSISMMHFWDSNNGLILALDTPNNKAGIWRIKNSGGSPCSQLMSTLAIKKTTVSETNTFALSPNPASSSITIKAKAGQGFAILNMLGQTLVEGILNSNENAVDISSLPVGVYLMRVGDQTKKWIKE